MANGVFYVSYELLHNMLHLPEDAKIWLVASGDADTFRVVVRHRDIVPKDRPIPGIVPEMQKVCPAFETDYDGGKTEYAVKFVSWN